MATVQQVRDLRAEGAPADLSPDSDMESPSMKAARELGYTASAFAPDDAASPLSDIEPVFGRPRTPQPYDYTPPPNLLEALRGALPYWGQGAEDVESNAKSDVQNASDEEVNRVDPETGDTPLLLSAQYGAGDLVEMLVERGADVDITLPSGATALHYMTNSSTLCPDAVIALLAVGADPSVADLHTGATPLRIAAARRSRQTRGRCPRARSAPAGPPCAWPARPAAWLVASPALPAWLAAEVAGSFASPIFIIMCDDCVCTLIIFKSQV